MGKKLLLRLAGVYIAVLTFGTIIIIFNNRIIYGSSLEKQFNFVIKAVLAGDVLFFLILMLFTFIRLKKVITKVQLVRDKARLLLLQRLFNFPGELFWGMLVISLFFSGLFHFLQWLIELERTLSRQFFVQLLHNLIAEQVLALTLAMLLYSLSRKLLRPFIAQLNITSLNGLRYSSIVHPLLITVSSVLLLMLLNMYRYVIQSMASGNEIRMTTIALIASTYFCIGLILFLWHLLEMREQINLTTKDIRELLKGDRTNMHTPMLVLSTDEVGQLKTIFNQLQYKIAEDYAELEREKELANRVQEKILVSSKFTYHERRDNRSPANPLIKGECTYFYDIIEQNGKKYELRSSISSKGLPAAIIMSAILVLFRTNIQKERNATQVLHTLQVFIADLVKELDIRVQVDIKELSL